MPYSCRDFADDVLNAFVEKRLIDAEDIPGSDRSAQAALVIEAVERLKTARLTVIVKRGVIEDMINESGPAALVTVHDYDMGGVNEEDLRPDEHGDRYACYQWLLNPKK